MSSSSSSSSLLLLLLLLSNLGWCPVDEGQSGGRSLGFLKADPRVVFLLVFLSWCLKIIVFKMCDVPSIVLNESTDYMQEQLHNQNNNCND